MAVKIKNSILLDMTPYSFVDLYNVSKRIGFLYI